MFEFRTRCCFGMFFYFGVTLIWFDRARMCSNTSTNIYPYSVPTSEEKEGEFICFGELRFHPESLLLSIRTSCFSRVRK